LPSSEMPRIRKLWCHTSVAAMPNFDETIIYVELPRDAPWSAAARRRLSTNGIGSRFEDGCRRYGIPRRKLLLPHSKVRRTLSLHEVPIPPARLYDFG
jgi:hypothetical protein